jgi:hypothetical protein
MPPESPTPRRRHPSPGSLMRRPQGLLPCALLALAFCLIPGCKSTNVPSPCQADSGAGSADTNPALVARAGRMLSEHGVTITDPAGDWVWPGNPEDNTSPYPVAWADFTSATFAVDTDYLYVRLTVNGVYPRSEAELPHYGQDQVTKYNANICLDTDNDGTTGCISDGGSEVALGADMMTTPTCGWTDVYDFWYGPTGIEQPETARYAHINNRKLMVAAWGGAGNSYRVMVYPAGPLGIHPGQTIGVIGWNECASVQYAGRHATFDVLGAGGMSNRVVVTLPL